MTVDHSSFLSLLQSYSCLTPKVPQSPTEKATLRSAIQWLTQQSEYENLGICADSLEQAWLALEHYLTGLGYTVNLSQLSKPEVSGVIYLKFNTHKMTCYGDRYEGDYRGVLIACQCEEDELTGTYGYFPLDLFDEDS
ncbi:MAG: DUF1824 family protein [Microcystaceae cyanobacterium]